MNYQTLKDGTFDYVQIGEWNNGTLSFFRELQEFAGGPVQSVCSKPCLPGHYKVTILEIILKIYVQIIMLSLFSESSDGRSRETMLLVVCSLRKTPISDE